MFLTYNEKNNTAVRTVKNNTAVRTVIKTLWQRKFGFRLAILNVKNGGIKNGGSYV